MCTDQASGHLSTTSITLHELFNSRWNGRGWRPLSDSGVGGECWRRFGGAGGSLIISCERRTSSLLVGKKLYQPPPPKKNSVPIKRTDVHLCNKLQTRVALGAIESPHCVRISHS